jgi:hypothetical protein
MKCPVCPGEIVGRAYTIPIYNLDEKEKVFNEPDDYETKYRPYCTECNTEFLPIKTFDTPEAALEAMRPVVSEELIAKVWELCGEFAREQHSTAIGLNPHGTHFNDAYIKQELEKYYAKD